MFDLTGKRSMQRVFIPLRQHRWLLGLGMLIIGAMSPGAAQNTIGVPGPGDADPLDAFGAAPNVYHLPAR